MFSQAYFTELRKYRDHYFKVIHVFNVNLRRATTTKRKRKRNQQTCYWRRVSQIKKLKAMVVCSLYSPLSLLQL